MSALERVVRSMVVTQQVLSEVDKSEKVPHTTAGLRQA